MRRITKFGSVVIALLIGVPTLLSLDFFDSAAASGPPLVYAEDTLDPVTHLAYPDLPRQQGTHTYAYVVSDGGSDALTIRERAQGGIPFYAWAGNGRITGLATDSDGSDYVFGTDTGQFTFVTTQTQAYDTEIVFETGSPVTDVAIDRGGNWAVAVTFHGDVFFFQRERLLEEGTFVWHHKAPMPAGVAPYNPDAAPETVRDLEQDNLGDITFRPYSQVAIAGAANALSPSGIIVVAGTATGEVWVFDPSQAVGQAGANGLRPETYNVGSGECQKLPVDGMDLESPCSREAVERLVGQIDSLTGGAANPALGPIRDALAGLFVLDPAFGVVPLDAESPIRHLAVTTGSGTNRNHLAVVADAKGMVHGLQIHHGSSLPSGPQRNLLDPLWTVPGLGEITAMDLSGVIGLSTSGLARLVIGDATGRLHSYNASLLNDETPRLDFAIDTGEGAIAAVTVSKGNFGDTSSGIWVSYVTDLLTVRLLDLQQRTSGGRPTEMWGGTAPVFGDVGGIEVTGTGSVLVATNGLTLYGAVPSVVIDAARSIRKGDTWTARAVVSAPDSGVATYSWALQSKDGTELATSVENTLEHTFDVEGTYTVRLAIVDDNGFTAATTKSVSVGGRGPVIELKAPDRATKGATVLYDLNGTHDPDANAGLGLETLTLYPYGNDTAFELPLPNLTVEVLYPDIGEFRARVVAVDLDGREAEKTHLITIADGGWCIPDDQVEGTSDGCSEPDPPIDDTDPDNDTGDGNDTDGGNGTTGSNQPPVAVFDASVDGLVLTADGRDSSDPDGDPLTYTWYFGDGSRGHNAWTQHAYALAGTYDLHLVVEDGQGGRDVAKQTIQIQTCGPSSLPDASGTIGYGKLALARSSGHTVSYGASGSDAGRFDLRSPTARLLHREPAGGPEIVSAALTADGCALYAGRADGTALYVNVNDPADRATLELFPAGDAIAHTTVSADGKHLLFASADGKVRLVSAGLGSVREELQVPGTIRTIVADKQLYNVVLQTTDGIVHLIDGQARKPGHRHAYDYPGTATEIEIAPNVDAMGRGWLFIGRSDGQIVTLKLQTHRFYVFGDASVQNGLAVAHLTAGPLDSEGHYLLGGVTASRADSCRSGTSSPCGQLFLIDSRGPYEDEDQVPIPKRTSDTARPTKGFAMNPEARHYLLISEDRTTVHRYDWMWAGGPQQVLSGFTDELRTVQMAANSNAYGLLDDGRLVWFFAPPLADFRAGTQDSAGVPQYGERISAKQPTTFDPSPTRPGAGRVVSYRWDFGDGTTSDEAMPTHTYAVQGRYVVQLTVTSHITAGRDTLLTDRYAIALTVWDPPPIAHLAAHPYDTSLGAVSVTSGEPVRFDASGSYDPNGGRITHYRFQFGDGDARYGTVDERSHSYARPGVYFATVTAIDDQRFSDTSDKVRIVVANRAPTAGFVWSQPDTDETDGWVTAGVPVRFDASMSRDPDGHVREYAWTFPGGDAKTGDVVWYTFDNIGDAVVSLKVRDDSGAWSEAASATVTVDDGIRLKHTQDPANGRTINPTDRVRALGLVHDFANHPDEGHGVPSVKVQVEVYYDGALGSSPADSPYETKTHLTDTQGKMTHTVAYNQGIAFKPGKYRIQLTAILEGSANGDTEYSQTTETHFVVT